MKEEAQSFFDLQKDSKNLTIEKKVEKTVFMAGPYKGYDLSYVVLYDTKYLKRMSKMPGLEKKTKNLIKQDWQRSGTGRVLQQKQLRPMHVQQQIQRSFQENLKSHQHHFPR